MTFLTVAGDKDEFKRWDRVREPIGSPVAT
jgi:hypothetical protein